MTIRLTSGGSNSDPSPVKRLDPTRRVFSPLESGLMAALIAIVLVVTMTGASAHLPGLSYVPQTAAPASR